MGYHSQEAEEGVILHPQSGWPQEASHREAFTEDRPGTAGSRSSGDGGPRRYLSFRCRGPCRGLRRSPIFVAVLVDKDHDKDYKYQDDNKDNDKTETTAYLNSLSNLCEDKDDEDKEKYKYHDD